jgi:hypothetical protein
MRDYQFNVVYKNLENGKYVEAFTVGIAGIDRNAAIATVRAKLAIDGCLLVYVY